MDNLNNTLIKLETKHALEKGEYVLLIKEGFNNPDFCLELRNKADIARKKVFGNKIYIRGLIEISNYCKNNCYYCGIRKDNKDLSRYRLTKSEIQNAIDLGYSIGFRTFVLQGGEDNLIDDDFLIEIIKSIKAKYSDCAITLSLGERGFDSFKKLKIAGADRYLLRHETINKNHYEMLHPKEMSYDNRVASLNKLKELGYQTGCGFMVESPYQTTENIAEDLVFIQNFKPEMVGIGPYIAHHNTPFKNENSGSLGLTCFLLSIIRLILPESLIPATTALGSIAVNGREEGIKAGANVIMPNLSPENAKSNYQIYDNKLYTGAEDAKELALLKKKISEIGYEIVVDKGDAIQMKG